MNNADRAAAALVALEAFMPEVTCGRTLDDFPEERVDYAKDLITNLLHFLREDRGLDEAEINAALVGCEINFNAEVDEEE